MKRITPYRSAIAAGLALAVSIGAPLLATAQVAPFSGPIIPPQCQLSAARANIGSCTLCHLAIVVINLTNLFMFAIALPSTALLIAIGGIFVLVAGPSETRLQFGKNILKTTVVGFLIVVLAWLAVDTTIKVLTNNAAGRNLIRASGFGPWNQINPAVCPF